MTKLASASLIAMSLVLSGPALAENNSPLSSEIQAAIVAAGNDPVSAIEGLVQGASEAEVTNIVLALSRTYPALADTIAATALSQSSSTFINAIATAAVDGVRASGIDSTSTSNEVLEIASMLRQQVITQLEQNPNANQDTVDAANAVLSSLNAAIQTASGENNISFVNAVQPTEVPQQVAVNTQQQQQDQQDDSDNTQQQQQDQQDDSEVETANLANQAAQNQAQDNRVPSFVNLPSQSQASGN